MSCIIEELVKAKERLEQEKGQLIMEKSAGVEVVSLLCRVNLLRGLTIKPEEILHG